MRTGLIGSATALLTAARIATAAPPAHAPEPPAPLAIMIDALPAAPAPPETLPQPAHPPKPADPAIVPAVPMPSPMADCACAPIEGRRGPREQIWLTGGPILWWIKDASLPTLAVSGNTQLGGDKVDFGTFNGMTLDGGVWLNDCHTLGIAAGGFFLEQRSVLGSLGANANGSPEVLRPVTDALTLIPISVLVSAPTALAGEISVATSSRMAGADVGFRRNWLQSDDWTVDTIAGFRYLDLDEDLNITQSSRALANGRLFIGGDTVNPVVGGLVLADSFQTRNQFYAGQVGARAEYRFGPVFVNAAAKVALGPNHEVIEINGQTRETGGAGRILSGGLLAVGGTGTGGNIGRQVTNRFAIMPELGAQIGAQVTSHVRLLLGYQWLYINDVVRPASQIDTAINQRLVPASLSFGSRAGQNAPVITARHDDFFAQGITFGIDIRY